jgi:hypothetical protein
MQAGPRTLQALLSGLDQYIIPFFQRYCAWTRKDWQRLLDDLLSLLAPGAPRNTSTGPSRPPRPPAASRKSTTAPSLPNTPAGGAKAPDHQVAIVTGTCTPIDTATGV